MSEQINPFDVLLDQYKSRKKEISLELQALNSSVIQTNLIAKAVKEHSEEIMSQLNKNKSEDGILNAELALEQLREGFESLNDFVIEQPLRIERGIIEFQAAEREIIGFENAIRQLKNQYIIEVSEDTPPEKIRKNNNMRRPGSRPESLKKSRTKN